VLVVTAAVAIVCPAVLGAAAATVTQSIATSAIIGAATSGVMNGIASMNSGNSFYDGFASGFESGAILGAISGGLGAGTSAIMSGAELTVGRVMAVKAMNMVSDATVDSVVYAYHSNKYDKDFTGGDIVKTWVKSAATSFAMQSVGGGKRMVEMVLYLHAKDGGSLKVVLNVRPAMGSQVENMILQQIF